VQREARFKGMADSAVTIGSSDHHMLALHGWLGSAPGWGTLPDYLDRASYTYAFMDLRGYGGRRACAGDFTMEEAAADALALAGELGWDRFSLIGHFMSGHAIQHVLLRAPGRVRQLVAPNPVPATGGPMDKNGWALFSGAAAGRDNRFAIINFATGSRLPAVFVDHVEQHSLNHCGPAAFGAYLESWAKSDFSDRVRGNQAAVKVVVGEHDPALPASVMEQTWLRFFPAAELEVMANAGHYPMYETSAALAASIEEFLGRD